MAIYPVQHTRRFDEEEQRRFGVSARENIPDVWVEVDLDDTLRVAFRMISHAGSPVPAEVRIFPRDEYPGRAAGTWRAEKLGALARQAESAKGSDATFAPIGWGLRAQALRRVPFTELAKHAQEFAEIFDSKVERDARGMVTAYQIDQIADFALPGLVQAGFNPKKGAPGPRRRSAWPDLKYAKIAAFYVTRLQAGSRRPVEDVARRYRMEATQVRDAIHTARQRGLLTPGQRGRSGGLLTPAGEALLKGAKK